MERWTLTTPLYALAARHVPQSVKCLLPSGIFDHGFVRDAIAPVERADEGGAKHGGAMRGQRRKKSECEDGAPRTTAEGKQSSSLVPWFSAKITRDNALGVFQGGPS